MAGITQSSHFKEYMFVFVLLAVFTVIELYIPGMKASTHVKGAILTALASIKAFAVAYYYMHLKQEKRWLKFIAAIPITAACYAIIVGLESVYR